MLIDWIICFVNRFEFSHNGFEVQPYFLIVSLC
jgi:hypothetical protein